MAGKVRVRTLFGHSHDEVELRNWRGYNVTKKLVDFVPFASQYGKWYVYHDGQSWCLVHGETGLAAGYGKTIREAMVSLMVRKESELVKAIGKYAHLKQVVRKG